MFSINFSWYIYIYFCSSLFICIPNFRRCREWWRNPCIRRRNFRITGIQCKSWIWNDQAENWYHSNGAAYSHDWKSKKFFILACLDKNSGQVNIIYKYKYDEFLFKYDLI